MHCKQADSAIMKLLLVQASNIFDHKTDFVVIMRFCFKIQNILLKENT